MPKREYEPVRTLQDYKLDKIDLLEEMAIYLSTSEIKHLMELESKIAVDQYAHSLIMSKL